MKSSDQNEMSFMRRCRKISGAVIASVMMAACGPILDLPGGGEPAPLYELRPLKIQATGEDAAANWILFVEEPSAPSSLRSERVAVRPSGRRIEYVADARWGDRAPELIGRYIVESIENAGVGNVVGQDHIELRGDYRLKMDIRDFSAYANESGGVREVKVRISALVVRTTSVSIVARQQFEASTIVSGDSIDAVIEAFNDAMDDVALRMITWLRELPAP